jgi:hypothetical protein
MKTFNDLTFEPHPNVVCGGEQAHLQFDNGRGISVITGSSWFNTTDDKPYEVGFRRKDGKLGCVYLDRDNMSVSLVQDADHNDVEGYCTEDEVTLIMKAIQTL